MVLTTNSACKSSKGMDSLLSKLALMRDVSQSNDGGVWTRREIDLCITEDFWK